MKLSNIKDVAVADAIKIKKFNKFVPAAVSSRMGRSALVVSKHSPAILFGAGVVGFGVTVALACKATLKLEEKLDEIEEKEILNPTKREAAHQRLEVAYAITKLYGPTIIVGTLSVAALTGSHHVLNKRYAGVTAAYAATEKAFAEYRERVKAEYGEEKERELRHGVEERTVVEETDKGQKKKQIKGFGGASQYAKLFQEGSTTNWNPTPEYNIMLIRTVQNQLNDMLRARGHVLLNDAYEALGFDRTKAGCVVGWVKNNPKNPESDNCIDFGVFDDTNMDRFHDFVTGREGAILIDFNVDGVVHDLI